MLKLCLQYWHPQTLIDYNKELTEILLQAFITLTSVEDQEVRVFIKKKRSKRIM